MKFLQDLDGCNAHYGASEDCGAQPVAVGFFDLRQRAVRTGREQKLSLALGEQLSGNQRPCQAGRVILRQPSADAARGFQQRALRARCAVRPISVPNSVVMIVREKGIRKDATQYLP